MLAALPRSIARRVGGRILPLNCHAGGNCDLKADQIAWKAYAAVRYVDAMESAG